MQRISTLILNPAFALVSINITPHSWDFKFPSSIDTCLFGFQQLHQWHNKKKKKLGEEINWWTGMEYPQRIWLHNICNIYRLVCIQAAVKLWLPFINKISFVTNKDYDDITSSFCPYLLDPLGSVQKWLAVCKVRGHREYRDEHIMNNHNHKTHRS